MEQIKQISQPAKINCPPEVVMLLTTALAKVLCQPEMSLISLGPVHENQPRYELCRLFEKNELVDSRLHHYPAGASMIHVIDLLDD